MNGKAKNVLLYLEIMVLAVLLALNYQLFVVGNGFAPSGLNGIATMVQYKTGFSIGYMSLLINIPLCLFAFFMVDRRFAVRSFCFCLVYSLVFLRLQQMQWLTKFQYNAQGHDTIFPVILSGVISGFVFGSCFRMNASAGGTDIVSKYINRIKPELEFFWVIFFLNALVAAASFFVYAQPGEHGLIFDYKPVCLCICYCFISSFVGNLIVKGTQTASKFTIITAHPDAITQDILDTLRHTTTRIPGMGGFSHEQRAVLICVVNRHQIVDLQNILKKYPDTFSFMETVNATYGNFLKVK